MSDLHHLAHMGEKLEQQQVQIDFMSVTQERQRSRIMTLTMTQRDLLDQLAVMDAKLELAMKIMQETDYAMVNDFEERVQEL